MQTFPGQDSGLVLKPFRGIRYAPDRTRDIAHVTSPPYDVIGTGVVDDLLTADPHNIVRLILPGASSAGFSLSPSAAGSLAAERLEQWLRSGVLARDPAPALYIYEQKTVFQPNAPSFLQRGIIGLVGVGAPSAAGVFPHEEVMPGPVEGRRALMLATRANLEPIFLVYNGAGSTGGGPVGGAAVGAASRLVDSVAAGPEGLILEADTLDGITHRLWRVTDPDTLAAAAEDLAGRTALIADGHHRYAAYQKVRASLGPGSGPWDYGLAFLVDADAYPPRLGAIHRVLPGLAESAAARQASSAFSVTPLPDDFETALARLASAGNEGHAFVLAGSRGFQLLTAPDPARVSAAMPPGRSARWRALDAAVLQELLLGDLWGIRDNERDVLVSHDAAEAVRMARSGGSAGGTAVICNPVPFGAVRDIAAGGECVPRKSTSFGPKPRTGLILRAFDD
ncbi:MAG TPA: DUF1015 domain-containing protein [Trebonia sp.]